MAAFYVYEHPCFTMDPLAMALQPRMVPEEYFSQMKSQNMLAKMVKEAKKQAQLEQLEQNYFEAINDFLEDITDSESEEENKSENMEECIENGKNDDGEKETEITVVQPEKSLEKTKNHSMTKVMVKEDLEKMEIKIELFGSKFKPEHLEINVSMDVLQPWLSKLKMEIKNLNDNSNCHQRPTSTKLIQNSSTRKKTNKLFKSQFQKMSRLFNFQFQWKKINKM